MLSWYRILAGETGMKTEDICDRFITGKTLKAEPFGDGHINDTYRIYATEGIYVLQRLQPKMRTDSLEHNYEVYSDVLDHAGILYPKWVKDFDGKYFYTDDNGNSWRMYPFIDGSLLSAPLKRERLFALGQGIAGLHVAFGSMDGKPEAVYPMLHDLKYYYDRYVSILKRDNVRPDRRDDHLEAVIESSIGRFVDKGLEEKRIVHGDPKLANILFKDEKVIAFLDMDTVMMGSLSEDIADCIRSCCVSDKKTDRDAARIIVDGYVSAAPKDMAEEIKDRLPYAFEKICFELALRYYTDFISSYGIFKENIRDMVLNVPKN